MPKPRTILRLSLGAVGVALGLGALLGVIAAAIVISDRTESVAADRTGFLSASAQLATDRTTSDKRFDSASSRAR